MAGRRDCRPVILFLVPRILISKLCLNAAPRRSWCSASYRRACPDVRLLPRQERLRPARHQREDDMADSVYKVIELIGTSTESWEKAASSAVSRAGESLRDLRVAEVVQLDLQLDASGKVEAYRAKLKVSFKFEGS
jgi:flavin-binding protein dodecin